MELIPILSTIILVATISTFILAVGAYILYKVQEKKADVYARRELETEKAELLEPEDFGGRRLIIEEPKGKPVFTQHYKPVTSNVEPVLKQDTYDRTYQESERKKIKRKPTEPKFLKFTNEGYITAQEDKSSGVISWR